MEENRKDFFVSYSKADRLWAEWIAWQLEEAGYTVIIQAWDFLAGSNFVLEMQKAAIQTNRTIAVLSPDYLNALYTQPEWAAAFVQDPTSTDGKLIPVRVRECKPQGMLAAISYIDLVGIGNEEETRTKLLGAISRQRGKPATAPLFPSPGSNTQNIRSTPPRFPGTLPALWNVPYQRNMFFTGREVILDRLHHTLKTHQATALTQPQAISGMGGIGKTQTALEYLYRYHTDYQAILWAQADSPELLQAEFVKLAAMLDLPEKNEAEQARIVEAVKRWLHTHPDWLLIFDNVEDIEQIETFIPQSNGHILLTTRASVTEPVAQSIQLDKMGKEESILFLLRRTKILSSDAELKNVSQADHEAAENIVEIMDGLPLALDQAGAYILATQCGLSGYLVLYQQRRSDLLKQRGPVQGHPDPVATTWLLSFEKIKQANPSAAAILQFCAFLYPDAIADELLTTTLQTCEPPALVNDLMELNDAIKILRTYSLVRRHSDSNTLSMHRLVQIILRDMLSEEHQRHWAERSVYTLNQLFPSGEPGTWRECERYILHAQVCRELTDNYTIILLEAIDLLYRVATYLKERALYSQAALFMQRALAINEQMLGPNHPSTATILNNLAMLYKIRGEYTKAEPLYQRALAIHEQAPGPNHPETANTLNSLAELYSAQGEYTKAEPLYQRALAICEQVHGPNHPDTAFGLNNLAMLYSRQGEYTKAEPLFQRALAICEQVLGPNHRNTVTIRNNYVTLFPQQHKTSGPGLA